MKLPSNFKFHCLFSKQNIVAGNVVGIVAGTVTKSSNQGVMQAMRDNGMLVVNEEGLFQSDLTVEVEVEPERTLEEIELECKKRKWAYELNRKFQDSWAAKLPWAESVSSEDGLVTHVSCKICTKVSGKDKLLAPKFDSLCKHAGRKKATSPMPGVPKGTFYYAKDCQHAKTELLYVSRSRESVLDRVMQGMAHEGLKKVIQFVTFLPTSRGKADAWIWKHEGLPTALGVVFPQYWMMADCEEFFEHISVIKAQYC